MNATMIAESHNSRIGRHIISVTENLLSIGLVNDEATGVELGERIQLQVAAPYTGFAHACDVLLVILAVFVPVVAAERVGVSLQVVADGGT